MAGLTIYLKHAFLDEALRGVSYAPPSAVYLALFTTPTGDDGSGTEVTGGSYARQPVTFSAPSGGAAANTAQVVFTGMPAASVTHAALMDASSGGNMLFHGPLRSPKTTSAGDSLPFAVGDVACSLA